MPENCLQRYFGHLLVKNVQADHRSEKQDQTDFHNLILFINSILAFSIPIVLTKSEKSVTFSNSGM